MSMKRGSSPSDSVDASASPPAEGSDKKRRRNTTRTSQACTRCRSLKMKCIGATDPPCRRCRRTGTTCDFVPRANAARPWSPGPYPSHTCTELWRTEVNARLKTLETANAHLEALVAHLRGGGSLPDGVVLPSANAIAGPSTKPQRISSVQSLASVSGPSTGANPAADGDALELEFTGSPEAMEGDEYAGVLEAIMQLKRELPSYIVNGDAWAPATICRLWESFRDHMPGLHFFSGQVSFVHPTPLLAVSILYVAAAHYPSPGMARHQPVYFQALTRAIGVLAVPDCPIRGSCKTGKDGEPVSAKFDDVLGIILVGLLAVGWVDTVGMWVNTAYRLLLDGMAEERGRRQPEWRGLWEGLRTIELEHSSLHLICPALPRSPPDPPFSGPAPPESTTAGGSIGQLLAIMQQCMPRFVGCGLPTVWETVCSPNSSKSLSQITAGPEDIAAIHAWAAEIDAWYQRTAEEIVDSSLYVKSITLLNYHLHKLFVLSIFFPLRGVAYTSASERAELLQSSRVVLKIENSGFEVWSSWDLVMITNASLILLQAYSNGAGEQEDLDLVQSHLNMLTCTHQTAPSLRHTLSNRLETALQAMRTPVRTSRPLPTISPQQTRRESNVSDLAPPTWSFQAQPGSTASRLPPEAPRQPPQPHSTGPPVPQPRFSRDSETGPSTSQAPPGQSGNHGYLFMDQAPDIGSLPNLSHFDGADSTSVAEWPPFLLNLFGYDEGSAGATGAAAPQHSGPLFQNHV